MGVVIGYSPVNNPDIYTSGSELLQCHSPYYRILYKNRELSLENLSDLEKTLIKKFGLYDKKERKEVIKTLYEIAGCYESDEEEKKNAPSKRIRHKGLYGEGVDDIIVIKVNGDKRIFCRIYKNERIIEIIAIGGHELYERLPKR